MGCAWAGVDSILCGLLDEQAKEIARVEALEQDEIALATASKKAADAEPKTKATPTATASKDAKTRRAEKSATSKLKPAPPVPASHPLLGCEDLLGGLAARYDSELCLPAFTKAVIVTPNDSHGHPAGRLYVLGNSIKAVCLNRDHGPDCHVFAAPMGDWEELFSECVGWLSRAHLVTKADHHEHGRCIHAKFTLSHAG